jgi:indole-3-glycerol phosphate synthase
MSRNRLDEILAFKRQELAQAKRERPLPQLERALKHRPPVRDFRSAICRPGRLSLIAEVKRASPSAGAIRPNAQVCRIARAYAEAGAQAVSVLTDAHFFSGTLEDLRAVRSEIPLPVLRKDFLLEEYHVVEAAAAGADSVLLIASALPRAALKRLMGLARDLGMEPLVEVHTERELGQALEVGAKIVGINNRDLATFTVDLTLTQRLARQIPSDRVRVSESGLRSPADVEFVRAQGVDAVLIGEELMTASDIGQRVKELMGW